MDKPHWADSITEDIHGHRAAFIENGVEFAFRWVPAGEDILGSPEDEPNRFDDEAQHPFATEGFWLGETPVTQAMYTAITADNPSYFKDETRPVERVSYFDVMDFCANISRKRGIVIAVPTEDEWEYACRAGTDGATYGPLDDIAVCNAEETAPVKSKAPNALGLYDMLGNVWEWCTR